MGSESLIDISSLNFGKKVGQSVYVDFQALDALFPGALSATIEAAGITSNDFTVVRLATSGTDVTLLDYPGLYSEAFPTLSRSWKVDLTTMEAKSRKFKDNKPVLHRKELLFAPNDPRREECEALTREAERLGLFENSRRIGHLWQWEEELEAKGVKIEGGRFVPLASDDKKERRIARHRTAMSRNRLSTPMQALWRHGFLSGEINVFDYGCGRGDDVAALKEAEVDVRSWDPYFNPDGEKVASDVVNIGFVINVIENPKERIEALKGAWSLTRKVLSVAAMIGGRSAYERFRIMGDGVLTSRQTFQKYFTHAELGEYIQDCLDRAPVSVAPGVYFVFRNDVDEQAFFERKQRSRRRLGVMPVVPRRERTKISGRKRKLDKWIEHQELLNEFWRTTLELARVPEQEEFSRMAELREKLGTPKRVINHLLSTRGTDLLEAAQEQRHKDLVSFLGINLFQRRKSFGSLPTPLQKDIKTHFGSYARGIDEARALLFSIAKVDRIEAACQQAARDGIGYLSEGESLQFESSLVNELPPILRVYIGAAEQLFGEVTSADLVKVHISSGKLSIMSYDDFYGKAIPMLYERVKIDLRRQRVDFFDYGDEFAPQPLFLKSRYMASDSEGYEAQRDFDAKLEAIDELNFADFGPAWEDFYKVAGHLLPPE